MTQVWTPWLLRPFEVWNIKQASIVFCFFCLLNSASRSWSYLPVSNFWTKYFSSLSSLWTSELAQWFWPSLAAFLHSRPPCPAFCTWCTTIEDTSNTTSNTLHSALNTLHTTLITLHTTLNALHSARHIRWHCTTSRIEQTFAHLAHNFTHLLNKPHFHTKLQTIVKGKAPNIEQAHVKLVPSHKWNRNQLVTFVAGALVIIMTWHVTNGCLFCGLMLISRQGKNSLLARLRFQTIPTHIHIPREKIRYSF